MSQRKTSIITQAILALCGIFFFILSFNFNDGGTSVYAGAGYYPMLVSGLITVFSITGILSDLFGKGKTNAKKIDMKNIKNVGYVVLAIAIILVLWHFFDLFYVGAVISCAMLLILLDPKPKTKKSVLIALAIAVGMSALTYVVFEYALHIHV